jgi:hypothetical protein
MPKPTYADPADLIRRIRPGDRVTIRVPNGCGRDGVEWTERTGKAVICNAARDPNDLTVALNMGGRYGTPGVATVDNIVKACGLLAAAV